MGPFSASPILTCWEGFSCGHSYVLTPRMHALLYFIIDANLDHIFVHSLPNLRKLVLEEKVKAFYFPQSSEGCSFAV